MDFTAFLLYCVIVTFTPGPTNIVILSTVHNKGTKKALEYTYGATIAFGLLLVLSAMLNSMLIEVIPKIIIGMQILGSFYMFYLAYQLYKADSSKENVEHSASFKSGFLMQFLNPKVVLFTITMGVIVITIIGFLAFITWVLFGTIFKRFLQRHKKIVNILMAIFLAYSGIMNWM